jgi:hypothetical protein
LKTWGSFGWGKNTSPSVVKKHFAKIKNGYYPIFPFFILEGVLWGIRGNQRNMNIPWNVSKNKVDLHTSGKR